MAHPARDEMPPGAWMRDLLNRGPSICELLLEHPGFDGLPERELL
jgi:hypothetical protein